MRFDILGFFLIFCAPVCAGVAVSARRDLRSRETIGIVALQLGVALTAFGYGLELVLASPEGRGAARCLRHLGYGVSAASYALVAARFVGFELRLAAPALPTLLAAAVAPPLFGLIGFPDGAFLSVVGADPVIPSALIARGPLYWFHVGLCVLLVAVGLLLALRDRDHVVRHHRAAADLLTASALPVIVAGLARVFDLPILAGIDPIPAAMVAAGGLHLLVLQRAEFLDLKPLARDYLMERFPDGIVVVDPRGVVVDHNAEATRLLGLTPPVVGRLANDVLREIPRVGAKVGADSSAEVEFRDRVVRLRTARLTGSDGRSAGLVLQIHDATEARLSERALAASLERESRLGGLGRELSVARPPEELPGTALPLIGAILEADECSLALDVDGLRVSGLWTPEGGVTEGAASFQTLERREGALSLMIDLGGRTVGALTAVRADRPFDAGDETAAETARWMLVNAVANSTLMNEMAKAALTDALTGLRNRKSFLAESEREARLAERHKRDFSVALCDLDHFKTVNDRYGHPAGDAVLVQLAGRVVDASRRTDIVCRWGGEEFAILMPESDVVDGGIAVDRVRRAIEAEPFTLDDGTAIRMTISAGVAAPLPGAAGVDVTEMMDRADRALYAAKRAGRNRVMIDDAGA